MSTIDAATEAKNIAAIDHQSGKGAEAAAKALSDDYNQILKENGGDTAAAKKWLQDTTAELAKAGVLPEITIGMLNNEKDNLSSDGNKITHQDIVHDNFLLGSSTGAQQSFDSVFTDMLANNTNGLADDVNKAIGSKDGTYSADQFTKFDKKQADAAQLADTQNTNRTTDAGLFQNYPNSNISILQYLDAATGGTPDGNISRKDIAAALANPSLPDSARKSILALQDQMSQNDWHNRSVFDILKQDGITVPSDSTTDAAGFYVAANKGFTDANSAYSASRAGA